MTTDNRYNDILRSDYENNQVRLDDISFLTADTDQLLHHLVRANKELLFHDADGREATLTPLLKNHVLTVLLDIRRKRLDGYADTFAYAQGTKQAVYYGEKLHRDIDGWIARLDAYLHSRWHSGNVDSPAAETARQIKSQLEQALSITETDGIHRYHRMLHTVTAIQDNADDYLRQAENSGDTEPALALLIAYLKNYASIIEAFNCHFASLPELYCNETLHALPAKAVPDKTYLVISPSGMGKNGFTLEKGTAFAAGEELIYKTDQEEYISPMQCVSVQTVYRDESTLYLQTLEHKNADNAETLFFGGNRLQTGWQIASPMLVMEDGRREVTISFQLKEGNQLTDAGKKQGFILQYSTEDGWATAETVCGLSSNELRFSFTIGRDGTAPSPCTEETHGLTTAYPALRILTADGNYPAWAEGLEFESIKIGTNVSGIRNFTLMNELGEADTTQVVSPFEFMISYS